ncbi:siderophore ferric iron reductase, partial [Achromobacter xylosoxidans]
MPDLSGMIQPVPDDGFIIGYTLERHEPLRGGLRERMQAAAGQLRNICATIYRALTQVLRVSPRAAESMQADFVLYA